jgi:LmbE family N-acetylglucosaminyl deacetylase
MAEPLRLLGILAHPDDESLGNGGTFARYAAEGVETYLVTATRGERGWPGDPARDPGPEALGRIRTAELEAAAAVLGIREVVFLDYIDGDLDQADPQEAVAKIVRHIRRVRPQVILTFPPDGAYGHPDHIAISQFALSAAVCAADANYAPTGDLPPHAPAKFYFMAYTKAQGAAYQSVFGDLVMHVDGVERRGTWGEDWNATTRLDTAAYRETVWRAINCHRSQMVVYRELDRLAPDQQHILWDQALYYRAYSTVNGGRAIETDLFAGLR